MAGVFPNEGEDLALKLLTNKYATTRNLSLRLYKTDITPGETDTVVTYTVANFTGYTSITLTGASWTATPGAPSNITYAQQSFTSTADQGAQLIYGYYLVAITDEILVAAEKFTDGPYTIQNNGDVIKVTPTITMA